MVEEDFYNTPDTVKYNGETLHFRMGDAIPFFLMPNGKIVKGRNSTRHLDYIESLEGEYGKRKFINSVILQGRYWTNSNIFSFWNLTDDDISKMKYVIHKISKNPYEAIVLYNNKVFKLNHDENDYEWFTEAHLDYDEDVIEHKNQFDAVDYLFKDDMKFVKNNILITTFKDSIKNCRPLNDYEVLAATAYQVWADYLKRDGKRQFSYNDIRKYIKEKYNGISFDSLLFYFHKFMRKKIISRLEHIKNTNIELMYSKQNGFEKTLNRLDFDDSEYTITYYEDSNEPYAYNIRTTDAEKFRTLLKDFKASKDFIFDRVFVDRLGVDLNLWGCRMREKYKQNESINRMKKIHITESQEQALIENIRVHKGEKGKSKSSEGKWADYIECPTCGAKAYFTMSLNDGGHGRNKIKVTDEFGEEVDTDVREIALYYCPQCKKFIAKNDMD